MRRPTYDPFYYKPGPYQQVHPVARFHVAIGLQRFFPDLSPADSVVVAHKLIKFLHQRKLQIGPAEAFGSHDSMRNPDIFTGAAQILEELDLDGRRPWIPDGER